MLTISFGWSPRSEDIPHLKKKKMQLKDSKNTGIQPPRSDPQRRIGLFHSSQEVFYLSGRVL